MNISSSPQRVAEILKLIVLTMTICVALNCGLGAQNIVYAVTNTAEFGTLDLDAGAYTPLGQSSAQLAGLGELGANLYAGELGSGIFDEVNLSNGSLIQLSPGVGTHFRGFGATTATLYAINSGGELYSIYISGTSFGEPVLRDLGPTRLGGGTLAMSADGTALYATLDPGTGSMLYSLNTATGGAAVIGTTNATNITSLIFRHGTLYAATAGGSIYTINITTGQATLHSTTTITAVGMAVPASSFTVLHTFTGHDGATPEAGLIADRAGNLYGTTEAGGATGGSNGTAFKMTKHGQSWTFASLYSFQDGADGASPEAPLAIGPDGAFYGTTNSGGNGVNDGTIFKIAPPAAFCRSVNCGWGKTTIHIFQDGSGCADPVFGGLIFDSGGNMYGTTQLGGSYGMGCVFEETRSGGNWTFFDIYSFGDLHGDGTQPYSGVIFDSSGNLYGTTHDGGADNYGTIYELSSMGDGWTEAILHNFAGSPGDGQYPVTGLLFDGVNNFYGTTDEGGAAGFGSVYQLTNMNGSWTYNLIYSFPHGSTGPYGGVIMDAAGNLYGTTIGDGQGYGSVYELTPANGGWIYTELYDFTRGADGGLPYGNLVFDSAGNLYGTASCYFGCGGPMGTVYKLTPQ